MGVFVPARLKKSLEDTYEPQGGSYYVNCPHVDFGFFGNLELFSKTAFTTLLDHIDDCKADVDTINWKVGIKDCKYGPMGEDLFAQTCLDSVGVRRKEAFDITTDGACPADRPKEERKNKKWKPNCAWAATPAMHPFKKTEEWIQCYQATTSAFGA